MVGMTKKHICSLVQNMTRTTSVFNKFASVHDLMTIERYIGGAQMKRRGYAATLFGLIGALGVVAWQTSQARRQSLLFNSSSQKALQQLDKQTFQSPEATHDKTLSNLRRTQLSAGAATEAADAWERGKGGVKRGGQRSRPGYRQHVHAGLEKRISTEVSKKLGRLLAKDVAKETKNARTQLIPDYTYKWGGQAGDDSSSTQKSPAGDYYGDYHGGSGGVHTGTYGVVGKLKKRRKMLRSPTSRTQLIPDYTYKWGGQVGDDSSSTQKSPAGDYYGDYHGGAGGVHTGTYGVVGKLVQRRKMSRS